MSIELNAIQRVRVFDETAANFGLDQTGASLGSFLDVPFVEGSLNYTLGQDLLDPQITQSRIDAIATAALGRKSCSLSFGMNLAPTGTAAGDTVQSVEGALGTILGVVLGGSNLATGQAATGTPTTTSIAGDVTSSTVLMDPGGAIGFLSGANSAYEMREIQTAGAVTLTLKHALSNAPVATDVIHGSASYFLTQADSVPSSFQFAIEGLEQDDRWLLMGCQLDSITFTISLNEFPRVTFNFKGVDWLRGSETASVLTGVPLGIPSFVNDAPIVTTGRFDIVDVGDEAIPSDDLCIKSLDLNLNISYAEIPCASGVGQVKRWVRTRQPPAVSGSFTTFYEDEGFFDDRDNRQLKYIFGQLGSVAGNSVMLSLPTVQIMDVQRVDNEGIAGQAINFQGQLDSDVTGTDAENDMALSPFRLHLG